MSELATQEAEIKATKTAPVPSPLASQLQVGASNLALQSHAGSLTPRVFSSVKQELSAAIGGKAIFDLGYRTRIRVTGEDRLRWLNGMVSNVIQALPEGHGNYNFILNAQGRIQGDAYIYRAADDLLLDTDRSQAGRLFAHLDHFIIMDDVELHRLDETTTGIGLTGPEAAAALDSLGLNASTLDLLQFKNGALKDLPVTLVRGYSVQLPRYELWFAPDHVSAIWSSLAATGANPIGVEAVEALRALEGTPRYGIDFTDRHLAQETSQTRALNFTKGCYLGQEIVERIRSRAIVHRYLRQFVLKGETPAVPTDLRLGDAPDDSSAVGQLTSVAELSQPNQSITVGLGFIRAEALERKSRIEYAGGAATPLDHPPDLT